MGESERKATGAGDEHIIPVTEANLEEIAGRNELIVIDFWNERCEYCKELAPIIEGLAADYSGRVAFGKLDVDKNRSIQVRFKVQAFPTLIILKNGTEVERIVGYVPREHLEVVLEKLLNDADEV